jgi:hypothetical protein
MVRRSIAATTDMVQKFRLAPELLALKRKEETADEHLGGNYILGNPKKLAMNIPRSGVMVGRILRYP